MLISFIAETPGVYALRVVPNAYQIVFDTYDDAYDHARRYAQWCRVDVWTIEPDEGFSPAARFRPPAGA